MMDPLLLLMVAFAVVFAAHVYSQPTVPPPPPPVDPELALLQAVEQLVTLDAWAEQETARIIADEHRRLGQ